MIIPSPAFTHAERIVNARPGSWLLTCEPVEVIKANAFGNSKMPLPVGTRVKITLCAGPMIFGDADMNRQGLLRVIIKDEDLRAFELEEAAPPMPVPARGRPAWVGGGTRIIASVAPAVAVYAILRYVGGDGGDAFDGFMAGVTGCLTFQALSPDVK